MLKHFFTILYRQFINNKMYMLIKLLGLSVGMAVSLLISLYVLHELSFDKFHENADTIYNVVGESHREGTVDRTAHITAAVGVSLQEEFPEILSMCRFSTFNDAYFQNNDQTILIRDVGFADSTVFNMFSFGMLKGNPDMALKDPFSIVLTESAAEKLFEDADPLGKILTYQGSHSLKVTGVMPDPPDNSHLQFGALISFSTLYRFEDYYLGWDGGWGYYTYVLTRDDMNWKSFMPRLKPFLEKHINAKYKNYGIEIRLLFDPLEDAYLYSSSPGDHPRNGDLSNILIFAAVAIFILLIAAINFMNLSTARYSKRAKEVGVRKVLGAERRHLRNQFLAESVLISILALLLATILVEIFLPTFNTLIDKNLNLYTTSGFLLPLLILIALGVGLLAGSYPAVFLSSFRPSAVIKGQIHSVRKGRGMRNALVVFQFFISGVLIIATLTIYRQLNYIYTKKLGYDKDQVVVLSLLGDQIKTDVDILKNELRKLAVVKSSSASSQIPVWGFGRNGYLPEGYSEPIMIHVLDTDDEYLQTMDIPLLEGTYFSAESNTDENDYVINRALAEKLGWENPVGKTISRNGNHRVIGMVDNFHFAPLHYQIEPLIITRKPYLGFDYLSVKLNTSDYSNALAEIEKTWKEVAPGAPFIYRFLDQTIEQSYGHVQQFGKMFTAFSLLAIFIACLGLFGLASFLTEQRRKEIGIRKTFGANAGRVTWMLGTDFTKMVLLGNLISWPVAWLIMQNWLENFAYKKPQDPWIFLLSLVLSLGIAMATVAWRAYRASLQNPVDSIRYE